MVRSWISAGLCAGLFFVGAAHAGAATQTPAVACSGASLRDVADHSHAKMTPCVTPHGRVIVETTYYQNASRIGGTALAAFPEARIRYGLFPRFEFFVDTPSEIAKSGKQGRGVYLMTQTGLGGKIELARSHGVVYSFSAESHPPLGALANLNLVPLSDLHLSANASVSHRREFGFEAGLINYETVYRQHFRPSFLAAASMTQALDARTSLTFELANQSNVYFRSRAQTSAVVSAGRLLNSHLLFNVELGDAFNAAGNSKPHYLGAGFTIH